jgi:hypothetical protein
MAIGPLVRRYAAALVSLVLIGGVWAEHELFHLPVGNAADYHARVRALADHLPYRIGNWVGSDVTPPQSAVTLLRPNLLLGRDFKNAETGENATLMIVQCQDARDMSGHWPPVCYPAHGWTLRDTEQREILVAGLPVPVMIYRFTIESIDQYSEIVIYNFFVRPDGAVESGRDGVRRAAEDPRLKIFGAAQFQIAFGASMDSDRRDEIFGLLVAGAFPVLQAVRGGKSG